jgi:6-phosphofructokinase 1
MPKTIGLITAGSDTPGLNAAIRAIGKTARGKFGMDVIGFQDGFRGLIDDNAIPFEGDLLSGILTEGGTILGTSREKPHEIRLDNQLVDMTDAVAQTYQRHGLDVLVCIGGRETLESALRLADKGLNVIVIPKATDNDIDGTDTTIGFNTAVEVAAESIDRLHNTANALHRILIVELLGRATGWLPLYAGIAGGADVILIPEIPYDARNVADAIMERRKAGKRFSIVSVAESIIPQEYVAFNRHLATMNERIRSGEDRSRVAARLAELGPLQTGSTTYLANRLEKYCKLETRTTILGYLLRGGVPTAADRLLATQFGSTCLEFINQERYGVMVAMRAGQIVAVPLADVAGKHKPVPPDDVCLQAARSVGTTFGD